MSLTQATKPALQFPFNFGNNWTYFTGFARIDAGSGIGGTGFNRPDEQHGCEFPRFCRKLYELGNR